MEERKKIMDGKNYILAVDQSTSGTKALLFGPAGELICRRDLAHRQIVDERGWVEHDPMEIYRNTLHVLRQAVEESGVPKGQIAGLGISNQRETAVVWDRETGMPVHNAVVWQCARGEAICKELEQAGYAGEVKKATGLNLSPYFSAAKIAWILRWYEKHASGTERWVHGLAAGTVDSWLVYKLTHGKEFKTDYSNASRTQLFNINTLCWDERICGWFGIPMGLLAQVQDSNGDYGCTDLEGFFDEPIPIHAVFGDSHGALYGQGCHKVGMTKATYGTGSSAMMNIGAGKEAITGGGDPLGKESAECEGGMPDFGGAALSIGYSLSGRVEYVLEGNVNYTGAAVKWLVEDVGLLQSPRESEEWARKANPEDRTYLVPAFSGLGAPYFDSGAKALFCGMARTTGKAELVRATVDSIAYQITDIIKVMEEASGIRVTELRVDGGPTGNAYLMQFQSDLAGIPVRVPQAEELSGIGAAYAAGIALGLYDERVFGREAKAYYRPQADEAVEERYGGWKAAVALSRSHR